MRPKSVLFVCTGNICRSPTAEGVLRHRLRLAGLEHITVDSAGTHGYHVGEAPDPRSVVTAKKYGYDISDLVARKFAAEDYSKFDLILALDKGHLSYLERAKHGSAEVALFLDYAGLGSADVPDPYYGDQAIFNLVLKLIEQGVEELLPKLKDV